VRLVDQQHLTLIKAAPVEGKKRQSVGALIGNKPQGESRVAHLPDSMAD
jgi:hypothetical protein